MHRAIARRWAPLLLTAATACSDQAPATNADASSTSTAASGSTGTGGTSTGTGNADSSGGSSGTTGDDGPADDALQRYCGDDHAAIEARIDEWLAQLSVADKVAMMHGTGLLPDGGTWHVLGNDALGIPGLHMLDGPRGVSEVASVPATAFPVGMARGATWDPALEREVGAAIAREIRSVGADVLLAPTMNLLRHPRWGRAQETYGEDTHHVGEMAVAFIEGVQSEHVIATAKHFAANSIEDTRFDVDVSLDERSLHEVFLPHFRRAVQQAHVGAVMSAYNSVNGLHCDVNPPLLRDILGDEWDFVGFVMSDWVEGTHGSVEAVRAGLDVEMPSGAHFASLPDAVAGGQIAEAEIDESLRGILRAQLCFALDTDPPVVDPDARLTEDHLALAEEVARRSVVLVRNEGLLPLDRTSLGEIAVVGPLADVENLGDDGSSQVDTAGVVTVLEGLVDRAGPVTVTHVPGDSIGAEQAAAITAADAVVLVVGLDADDEGEGLIAAGDRESLALPADQLQLIHDVAALGRPTVVVLEGGGPILVSDWMAEVDAIAIAWYPGVRGGYGIADVLFGDAEPSGRLPASVPFAEADLPPFDNVSLAVDYGYLHGYRWLDAMGTPAALPLGFGLSYSTVRYDAIGLEPTTAGAGETVTVTVTVTNTGARPVRETVQLYVEMPGATLPRAPRDLRAFAQIDLAPGERGVVPLQLAVDSLAGRDPERHAWVLEPGVVQLKVGSSAAQLDLIAQLTISP